MAFVIPIVAAAAASAAASAATGTLALAFAGVTLDAQDGRRSPADETVIGFGRSLLRPQPPAPLGHGGEAQDAAAFAVACGAPTGTLATPVFGVCVAPLLREGDVSILHGAGIKRGDLMGFAVAGDPLGGRGKAYLGTAGPSAVSRALYGDHPGPFMLAYQWNPRMFVLVPLADLKWLFPVWGRVRGGVCEEFEDQPAAARIKCLGDVLDVCEPEELAPVMPSEA